MGAGCSSGKAAEVQDSVNKITLNAEAKQHLKSLSNGQSNNIDMMSKIKKKGEDPDGDVENGIKDKLDQELSNMSIERKHQKLWDAIETNEIKTVEAILSKLGGDQQLNDADLYDSQGQSMAHKAASLGHVEILMLLLERTGGKPEIVNAQLATPLHLACKNNRESVARFLIGCGVDVNSQDEHGQTPLLICCIHGHYDLAQLIVDSSIAGHTPEPLEIDLKDHRGLTSLNCAAIKGDLRLSRLLIERGNANIEEASPKGCTPLIYSARGGYHEVARYLLEKGASPLKQDNSGATVLHHAIEKSHIDVLNVFIEHGVDVYSAIEIADNAGRTPLFEGVDNNVSPDIIRMLTRKRNKGGFGAQVNVINYNGQTPLFSAVREGNLDTIMVLIEEAGSQVDLTGGEVLKDEEEQEEFESTEEKYFMEAYRNATYPLQLACILGHDQILHYLIEKGANPNLQTNIKGYACLHLAVLANKPEIIIELLTRTNASPHLPDYSGRTFIDMVEMFIPDYLGPFNTSMKLKIYSIVLENLHVERIKRAEGENQGGLVATHYYNPDDEREIKGVNQDINDIYSKPQQNESPDKDNADIEPQLNEEAQEQQKNPQRRFMEMDDAEIEVEENKNYEREVEAVFGRKIALGLMALNWKFKEMALKIIYKQSEKFLTKESHDQNLTISDFVKACTIAIDMTCKEKVIKVLNISLQLLNLLISSAKIEQSNTIEIFKKVFIERNIVLKLLQKSEEGNTRMTNKIHECLLDFSFHPKISEAHVSSCILQRIQAHNKASNTHKQQQDQEGSQQQKTSLTLESALGSYKGLLAQLALLYKFVNSFGVSVKKRGPLNIKDIINAIIPSLTHQSQDVRNASTKILLDVQRLSGAVKEEYLASLNEKIKAALMDKIQQVPVERNQNQNQKDSKDEDNDSLYEYSQDESELNRNLDDIANRINTQELVVNEAKEKIIEKGQSKDWTEREMALKHLKDTFENSSKKQLLQEDFLTNCTILLKSCLEENNLSLYLVAVEVSQIFFEKALFTEVVLGSLQSLIKAVVLKTTDTNTRVRKKSVDLINQIWSAQNTQSTSNNNRGDKQSIEQSQKDSIPNLIAEVICDSQLQEKAIIGRLGLFIKRASLIESGEELNKKPHQMILGKNYEQLIEFACTWCTHKNTKVRQNALKLIIEVCRLNSIDPRGQPFKQRIINFILGLRPSLRDPLVKKINEVCFGSAEEGAGDGDKKIMYIDVNELELNLATKTRSVSMDVHNKRKQGAALKQTNLPDIGGNQGSLPQVNMKNAQPTIVLPHAEPLSEEQKIKSANLIETFNLELVTCFYSQFWSARMAAIEKVGEQLYNLDPNRRDAMSSEINRKNLPIDDNFKVFLEFIDEGCKDPVLKNYLAILELFQKALPIFFRYVQPQTIRRDLQPLVTNIIKKTSDLKAKVREASINFCLYLSHQSPIGPEAMVTQVLSEIELVLNQQQKEHSNVAANLGNSHMITSCFQLLTQFQQQTKILEKQKTNQVMLNRFMTIINICLKHQNPIVRKESEVLFKALYAEFGEKLDSQLIGQKQQVSTKLLQDAKTETGQISQQQAQDYNLQKAQTQIRADFMNQSALNQILKGCQEQLQNLKLPNPKKRLKAIIEIKKAIQKEIVSVTQKTARDLFEPLSLLMRQLLSDEDPDIYLETLNLLKFVVGSLAPHLSTLDLHLMLGSFIGVIVSNTVSSNMRTQMASDKVIIFFAKHNNIGPFVVAKDILKNIEKCVKVIQVIPKKEEQQNALQEKKPTMLRFLSILSLLLQHFSIVLCYQSDFYDKCIELIADTMIIAQEDQTIKNLCVQLIVSLQTIDSKLLEASVQKQDVIRKTPLRKTMIELEHQQRQGKNVITQDHHAFVSGMNTGVQESPAGNPFKDTRGSVVSTSRTSLFSPGSTMRGNSPGFGVSQDGWSKKSIDVLNQQLTLNNNNIFKNPESRAARRMISLDGDPRGSYNGPLQSIQGRQQKEDTKEFILPEINPMVSTNYNQRFGTIANQSPTSGIGAINSNNKMSLTSTGGAGFNSSSNYGPVQKSQRTMQSDAIGLGQGIRPPLYVPTKRDSQRLGSTIDQNNAPIVQQQPATKQSFDQFKTEFNSNLYSGSIGTNNSIQPSKLQKQTSQTVQNSIFKGQQPKLTFESGVKRYQEQPNNKGPLNEF